MAHKPTSGIIFNKFYALCGSSAGISFINELSQDGGKIHGSVYLYKQSPYEAHAIIDSYCRNNKRILSQQIIYVAKTIKSHCLNNGFTLTK